MKVQAPAVGPIIGHTSRKPARIWLRGHGLHAAGELGRCFGVFRLKPVGAAKFVKLEPHFDFTGVAVFNRLEHGQAYEYQAGWFLSEAELEELDDATELDWAESFAGTFTTSPAKPGAARTYIVGSCRYLLLMAGGTVFDKRGDKTFRTILDQMNQGEPADGLIMIGDQIYADDLNALRPDEKIDQFLKRYRIVFSQEHHRQLMARVPTYMMLDDHEIEDNWPENAEVRDRLTLYPHAMHAYQIYQASHSPLIGTDRAGRLSGRPEHWWYTFEDGCCDWFMMDCRTERVLAEEAAERKMISDSQMTALKRWLGKKTKRVKVIASSVPIFPDLKKGGDDKWSGFACQRTELLDFIFAKKIRKVIFLGGDVHCSMCAELTRPDDPRFRVLSVVSSSFFWPYPQYWPFDSIGEKSFQLRGRLAAEGEQHYVVSKQSCTVFKDDNFARVRVDTKGVSVRFISRKGAELDSVEWSFSP